MNINNQVDKAFKQLMTEISSVAKEINSNALLKNNKTELSSTANETRDTISSDNKINDISLSLTSLSSAKPVSLPTSASSPVSLADISSKFDELLNGKPRSNTSNKMNLDDTTASSEELSESNDKLAVVGSSNETKLFIVESNESDSNVEDSNESVRSNLNFEFPS